MSDTFLRTEWHLVTFPYSRKLNRPRFIVRYHRSAIVNCQLYLIVKITLYIGAQWPYCLSYGRGGLLYETKAKMWYFGEVSCLLLTIGAPQKGLHATAYFSGFRATSFVV